MRVIAGSARGIYLSSVKGSSTRPIPDRIKGSLFNILADVIPGSRALDMYAGTGAIGIEALSRGAKSCVFVENDWSAVQVIKKNLEATRLQGKARVLSYDVFEIVPYLEKNNVEVDLIFASPPYPLIGKSSYRDKLLILFSSLCSKQIIQPEGLIMLQHRKTDFELVSEGFSIELFDIRIYGDTQLSFFKNTMKRGHSL
ncbi:MAG: 16S rRNA (guanine(966)-N(2))-methyltransferase RsmD [Candidatus Brocadia sp. AMX2]|uniref:16S rRNA (guanine(966)-N(2))-methyltransferase RsmD n=1 Tax=Candidatus Brocadia TaxID=380240 RepID=UPI0006982800|nr:MULTISPECIES: 16S rRNA (guanine(966)-N(2))-methyltransferase RsmD [Brocadia]KXK29906.1 MAG: putative methyltransferase [Candidatus Brocadia sinica]MBC6932945.1 16S rRNA (guanine(966)-N(2))-methyltransferase RsmD [Candidatus Brocadia sp.]MBL1169251.1 16S rRNA (guanine(966)-N(2))-methyltransferase RsmD [Candidatus Brocadia sp. AMX1]KAA0241891.1 MAG: 16S rRNA (guanine(966)-N(2))-methyltransferase RsmD [Candidatus Brocadia sp. AMX2]MCE7867316.1 16S rRNA (guanine(966)-N(2))-methyltransferase Rsm